YLRVPQAQFGPIVVPEGVADERFLYLSDILPTAWQGVEYAEVPEGGSLAVFGLGPVGLLAVAIGVHRGLRVVGIDNVPERMAKAEKYGATVISSDLDDVPGAILDLTDGRGVDGGLDAVGMEAHGSPIAEAAIKTVGFVPDTLAKPMMEKVGIDRLAALRSTIGSVRRGGTVSVSGVYGGMADPMPMMEMFDKGLTFRMGQCHVRRWIDDIVPVVLADGDPLGLETLATHRLPLEDAPAAYAMFQKKEDGCVKVVLKP
ncbi:MAG: zinc-binding dehydrogenase, partial [Knoellia sp.]